jgi:hypothetical protein
MMFVSVAAETASLERPIRHFRCIQASGLQERNQVEFIRNGVTRTECSVLGWYPFEAATDLAEGRRSQSSALKERIRGKKSLDFSFASFLSLCRVVCDGWWPSIHSIAFVSEEGASFKVRLVGAHGPGHSSSRRTSLRLALHVSRPCPSTRSTFSFLYL